jgi:hypothetical protein
MQLTFSRSCYPHRFVFIAGLPKAGTTWMENLIDAIPGYKRLAPYDPARQLEKHVLDPVLLEKIPVKGNFFLKTHVEARRESVSALIQHNIPTLIMIRDLRDQCVSRFFHVQNQPSHRHHVLYTTELHEIAFRHCIDITITEYAQWIRGWLEVMDKENRLFKLIRYEDMRKDVVVVFQNVLIHFDVQIEKKDAQKIVEQVTNKSRQTRDLKKGIKKGNNTFRSGKVGEWRDHFNRDDVAYFKKHANDVLLKCGYETNENW